MSTEAATEPSLADVAAERSMLASVWLSLDADMVRRLDGEDFIEPFNRWLLGVFKAVVDDGDPLDMVAVKRRWRRPGGLDGLTPAEVELLPGTVADLLRETHTAAHKRYYFRVLRTERLRRAVGRLSDAMRERIEKYQHDPAATLAWAGEQIERLLTKAPVDE